METIIERIGINWQISQPGFGGCFILLKEKDGERYLPIFVDQDQAYSIIIGLEKIKIPRPHTHDLLFNAFKEAYGQLKHVEVNDLKEGTFYAKLVFEKENNIVEIDSRPSDAIAISLRDGCPIIVSETVMEIIDTNQDKIKQVKKISTLWPLET